MQPLSRHTATIAFFHTSPVHIETFRALLASRLPDVAAIHRVDERLLDDARRHGITDDLATRVHAHLNELAMQKPALIVCTCSTIGSLAETTDLPCPVVRVDRPMAEAAIALAIAEAGTIGLAAALSSTVDPTRALLHDVVAKAEVAVPRIELIPCFDAWPDFERGDTDAYAQAIAATIRPAADRFAVIVLAQASMASALPYLADVTTPILASPERMIDAIAKLLESHHAPTFDTPERGG